MTEIKKEEMSIREKLMRIQVELKAPKSRNNSFGKYNYRSAEDIQEALKPLLDKYGATVTISDTIQEIGGRIYVKSTATFADISGESKMTMDSTNLTVFHANTIEVTAYAREAETKKGMDDAQVTGATSSYARKYALNGLFLLDDTKDVDSDEYQAQKREAESKATTKTPEKKTAVAPTKQATTADAEKEKAREKYNDLILYCKENNINIKQVAADCGLTASSTAADFEMALVYAETIFLTPAQG